MPDRIVRANIKTSEKVDQLDWAEEVFYRRMINAVDDFGRFDARPAIIRSEIFPLRTDRVREADITRWMAACQKAGLFVLYEADGKPYVELLNLGDRRRAKRSKYPPPPGNAPPLADTCQHMPTHGRACPALSPDSDSDSDAHTKGAPGLPPGFAMFWQAWPQHERKVNRKACLKHWESANLECIADTVCIGLEWWKKSRSWTKDSGQFIPQPLTWLHQSRWEAAIGNHQPQKPEKPREDR